MAKLPVTARDEEVGPLPSLLLENLFGTEMIEHPLCLRKSI